MIEHVTLPEGASFRVHARQLRPLPFHWHFHAEYELTLITVGAGRWCVGDVIEPCRSGDMVLVGPDLPHALRSEFPDDTEAVVVHFRHEFLGRELWQAPEFVAVAELLAQACRGLAFTHGPVDRLRALVGEADPAGRVVMLLEVLVALTRTPRRVLAGESFRAELNTVAQRRIDAIYRFLAERYTEPITLAEVARAANLSPTAFCRFFRRTTRHTLTSYLRELRISAARRRLIETDQPVARIAAGCGFTNLSHFNRVFRQLTGHTPRRFRALSRTGL